MEIVSSRFLSCCFHGFRRSVVAACCTGVRQFGDQSTSVTLKRPPGPFAMYVADRSASVRQQYPDLNNREVMQQLSNQWKKENADIKQPYFDRSELMSKEYAEMKKKQELPKRPPTAYVQFFLDNFDHLRVQHPGASFAELGQKGGLLWKEQSTNVLDRYKSQYRERLDAYFESLSDEDKQRMAERKKERSQKGKKSAASSNEPKRKRLTGFSLYVSENASAVREERGFSGNVLTALGKRWKTLSEAEQRLYADRALQINHEYNQDIDNFKKIFG